jgi:prevent-host-death family protein
VGIQVNVFEAKSSLSRLLAAAERGEDVVIARAGRPVVRLQLVEPAPPRQLGLVAAPPLSEAFFEPMTASELASWEGGE